MRLRRTWKLLAGIVFALAFCVLMRTQAASAEEIPITEENFPDGIFRMDYLRVWDTDHNEKLSDAERAAVTEISIESSAINSLKGIEYFTNLVFLECQAELMGTVDLSKNTKLTYLSLGGNYEICLLDLSKNTKLETLILAETSIRSVDLTKLTNLKTLILEDTPISTLNLKNNTKLEFIDISETRIKEFNPALFPNLWYFRADETPIQKLDFTHNTKLQRVECSRGDLNELVFGSKNTELTSVVCERNRLSTLSVSTCSKLVCLKCQGNDLSTTGLYLNSKLDAVRKTANLTESTDNTVYGAPLKIYKYYTTNPYAELVIDKPFDYGKEINLTYYTSLTETETRKQKAGVNITVEKFSKSKTGYYFLGWSLAPGATAAQYKSGDKFKSYSDCVLYAVWKPITIKVKFDLNGGTSGAPATISLTWKDSCYAIPPSSPVREGYYFLGWAEKKNATQPTVKAYDVEWRTSSDMVWYAVWKPRKNKITFDRNGGSGNAPSPIYVLSGNEATIPKASVSRTGYYFLGWALTRSATAGEYKSGDKISVTKDTVLYAVWKAQSVSLTFDVNGGTGTPPAKITTTYGGTVTVPKANISREGYYFLGWADSKTATTAQYKSGSQITLKANLTIYAVWKKK
ncbi:MAG: InlB B-repeat-containing protein [Lachnospiraceae bacterium]|nr:InlB B-repeat-containing protein [Lachnospiraceae bacterium]